MHLAVDLVHCRELRDISLIQGNVTQWYVQVIQILETSESPIDVGDKVVVEVPVEHACTSRS